MDAEDLTATVREARAERDEWIESYAQQMKVVDGIATQRDEARAALVEIGQLASAYHADTRQQIIDLAQGIVGTIISTAPYGIGFGAATAQLVYGIDSPSMVDACTVRDTTTDQSKIRNHPDEITQAEREAFWEGRRLPRGAGLTLPAETWVVFERRLDDPGWREISRQEAICALDAVRATVTPPMPHAWFGDADRTMTAVPVSALGEGFAVNATTTTDTQVTVTPKESADVPQ